MYLHRFIRFRDNTPKDTAIKVLVLLTEEVITVWSGEIDIQKPSRQLIVSKDHVLEGRPVIEIQGSRDPGTACTSKHIPIYISTL